MTVTMTLHGGTTAITLTLREINNTTESENELIPISNEEHQFVFLGNKGDTLELVGDVFSSTDYAKIKAWNGQILLDASSSSYPEIPDSTYWAIISRKLSRKGGYLNRWTYNVKITQVFSGKTTLANGTSL